MGLSVMIARDSLAWYVDSETHATDNSGSDSLVAGKNSKNRRKGELYLSCRNWCAGMKKVSWREGELYLEFVPSNYSIASIADSNEDSAGGSQGNVSQRKRQVKSLQLFS